MSTKPKVEVDALTAATKAKADALKARAKANHSTAVVHVSTQALAKSQSDAAEHHLAADAAEKHAAEHADLARKALEESLGMEAHEEHHEEHLEEPAPVAKKEKP